MAAFPLTLPDWRRAYAGGATPQSLLPALLHELRSRSPKAAWIHLASDAELAAQLDDLAARLAAADKAGEPLPLYGVPYAAKDNIDIAGVPTTAACPAFSRVAERDATAVARLRAAGAIWLGKTNLDQFATGLVGTRSPYGQPESTVAAGRISGGSSSGSAVAVGRGDVAFALGTDTAGSGRVPAGFNRLVGLKPTPGRVGTAGVLPACRSLDCVSILALTVADAAEVLAVIEGADADDAYCHNAPGPLAFPSRLRVGIPAAPILSEPGYAEAWAAAVKRARALGFELVEIDFSPLHEVAALLYGGPWVAERHAVVQALLDSDPDAFDPTVRRVIEGAKAFSATDTFRAQYKLRAAQQTQARLWQQVDLLMTPTAPRHPSFEQVAADPVGVNAQLGAYTNFVNLLGWSALALPSGDTAEGLPFGVTFIAPGNADAALARLGMAWQAASAQPLGATGAALDAAPPLRWPANEPTLALAVVGAHLSGLPLNGQLLERGATLAEATRTAPRYRLYALPGTVPPKPGLVRSADTDPGAAIEVEVWQVPQRALGSFLALIPAPLGLGSIELADGRWVHGFLCESRALVGAQEITALGGWRAYLASR